MQIDYRGFREFVRDVVLKIVIVVADVVVEVIIFGSIQDARIVIEIQTHVIGRPVSASLNVDIGALVHVEIAEHETLPVDVGIYIRCSVAAGHVDLLLRVFGRFGSAGEQSLIVAFHPGGAVDEFGETHGLYKRILDRNADFGPGVLLAFLRRDDHYAVGAADAVDGRGRGIFENRKAFDGFGRNAVQILGRNLDVVEQNERRCTASERPDAADVEFGRRSGLARRSHGDHTGQFAGKSRRQ